MMPGRIAVMAGLTILAALTTGPAEAAFESAYTDINLDDCLVLEADDFGVSWACPGYRGFPLWVAEGDLRFFLSYGFSAPREMIAGQTLPPFNRLGPRIEWRLSNDNARWFPVATIVRYFISDEEGEETGEVLVVSQIAAGNSCHIAYIDARANNDANDIAREVADERAGTIGVCRVRAGAGGRIRCLVDEG